MAQLLRGFWTNATEGSWKGPNDSAQRYTKHQTQGEKKNKGPNKKPSQKEKKTTKSQIATQTTTKNEHKNNKKTQTRDLPQLSEFLVMCIFQFLEQLTKASHGVRRIGPRQRYVELPNCKTSTILVKKTPDFLGEAKKNGQKWFSKFQVEGFVVSVWFNVCFHVNLFEPRHGSYDLNVNFRKEKIEDLFAGPRELLNQDNQNEWIRVQVMVDISTLANTDYEWPFLHSHIMEETEVQNILVRFS